MGRRLTTGKSAGTRLDPNIAAALAYVFGPIGGAVFLIVEKDNVRHFHALQSIVTFVGITVPLGDWNLPSSRRWRSAADDRDRILWVFLIIKAFMNERYKLVIGTSQRQLASRAR